MACLPALSLMLCLRCFCVRMKHFFLELCCRRRVTRPSLSQCCVCTPFAAVFILCCKFNWIWSFHVEREDGGNEMLATFTQYQFKFDPRVHTVCFGMFNHANLKFKVLFQTCFLLRFRLQESDGGALEGIASQPGACVVLLGALRSPASRTSSRLCPGPT